MLSEASQFLKTSGCIFMIAAFCSVVSCRSARTESSQRITPDVRVTETSEIQTKKKVVATESLDTADWKELKSHWGWKLLYPKDWKAENPGPETPETSDMPIIESPRGDCVERCATLQISREIPNTDSEAQLSPKEYVYRHIDKRRLNGEGELQIGGSPAYQLSFEKSEENEAAEVIWVKHDATWFEISYSEFGYNQAINSPRDWKYTATFGKILASFRFIPAICTTLPCK